MSRPSYLLQIVGGAPGHTRVLRPPNALLRRWELAQSPSWLAERQVVQSAPPSLEAGPTAADPLDSEPRRLSTTAPMPEKTVNPTSVREHRPLKDFTLGQVRHETEIDDIRNPPTERDDNRSARLPEMGDPIARRINSDQAGAEQPLGLRSAARGKAKSRNAHQQDSTLSRFESDGLHLSRASNKLPDEGNVEIVNPLTRPMAPLADAQTAALMEMTQREQQELQKRSRMTRDDANIAGPPIDHSRVTRPQMNSKSSADSIPEVKIGTVEIVIAPPPAPVAARGRSSAERSPALSRGYVSAIGLRQR